MPVSMPAQALTTRPRARQARPNRSSKTRRRGSKSASTSSSGRESTCSSVPTAAENSGSLVSVRSDTTARSSPVEPLRSAPGAALQPPGVRRYFTVFGTIWLHMPVNSLVPRLICITPV